MRIENTSSPTSFFTLVFVLTVPFWVLGDLFALELMPGLPLASLMVVTPTLAALYIRWQGTGPEDARNLLARAVDVGRLRSGGIVVLLLLTNPLIYVASYGIQAGLIEQLPVPDLALDQLFSLFAIFLIAAVLEELGWTGHATELLRARWNTVQAGLILGMVCTLWHLVPLIQVGRSAEWILWWATGTVATRILIVWFYEQSGRSVFIMSVFHALSNTCWQLYPVQGSHYDPQLNAAITVLFLLVIVRPWRTLGERDRSP